MLAIRCYDRFTSSGRTDKCDTKRCRGQSTLSFGIGVNDRTLGNMHVAAINSTAPGGGGGRRGTSGTGSGPGSAASTSTTATATAAAAAVDGRKSTRAEYDCLLRTLPPRAGLSRRDSRKSAKMSARQNYDYLLIDRDHCRLEPVCLVGIAANRPRNRRATIYL